MQVFFKEFAKNFHRNEKRPGGMPGLSEKLLSLYWLLAHLPSPALPLATMRREGAPKKAGDESSALLWSPQK